MSFDPELAARIRRIVGMKKGFSEKKMFGGLAFMLGDKMCCGVLGDKLVARIGLEQSDGALRKPHVSPMDFTGRPLKGYVYVAPEGTKTKTALQAWIQQAIAFTSTLAGKTSRRSKPRTVSQIDSDESTKATRVSAKHKTHRG